MAVYDSAPAAGYVSGLHLINKKPVGENATTVKGQLLKPNKSYTLVCSVRSGKMGGVRSGLHALPETW
jgi:hypothetical protein